MKLSFDDGNERVEVDIEPNATSEEPAKYVTITVTDFNTKTVYEGSIRQVFEVTND